ncbi:MAG: tetraacyldisaccharide 4'-kinase [Adhaeribacter sp.]
MNFLKYPLLPFAALYAGIMRTRNWMYDTGMLDSHRFPVPVICVGNLTVGGTGKTPHVEYLVRLLQPRQVAILSRGYKRKTRGFVLADAQASAATIGDEPFQYYREFPGVRVAVCEDRVIGINQLLQLFPATEVVLLDDALQHRPVQARANILLTDYNRLFYQDAVLPAGRLREAPQGAARADVVVVSKCPPNLAAGEREQISREIGRYTRPGVPVFFSYYRYGGAVAFGSAKELSRDLVLVTGIAQPGPLVQHLQQEGFRILRHFNFADHHAYTQQDIAEISNFAREAGPVSLLTTQKDWTRLADPAFGQQVLGLPFFYVPIAVAFVDGQQEFDQLIFRFVVKEPIAK